MSGNIYSVSNYCCFYQTRDDRKIVILNAMMIRRCWWLSKFVSSLVALIISLWQGSSSTMLRWKLKRKLCRARRWWLTLSEQIYVSFETLTELHIISVLNQFTIATSWNGFKIPEKVLFHLLCLKICSRDDQIICMQNQTSFQVFCSCYFPSFMLRRHL